MGAFKDRDITESSKEKLEEYTSGIDFADTFEGVFSKIYSEALEILIERQRKYGPDNIFQQGIYGIVTRIKDDKLSRVKQALNGVIENGDVHLDDIKSGPGDDTFEDALIDIANYALIALALHRGLWGRPLMRDTIEDFDRFIDEWENDNDFNI